MICHISHICMFTALSLVLFQFYKGGRLLLPALPSTTRRSSGTIWPIVSFCLYIYSQIHTYIVKLPAQCFTVCWLKWSLQQSHFLQCTWPAGSLRVVVAENLDRCCWNFELVISAGLICSAKPSVNWFPDRLRRSSSPFSFSVSATAAAPSSSSLLSPRSTSAGTGSDRKWHLWFHRWRMERKSDFFFFCLTINSVKRVKAPVAVAWLSF